MLTDSKVLEFIKDELGYPFTEVELADEDILRRTKKQTLPVYFSPYVPVYKYLRINVCDKTYATEDSNRFRIVDPDGAGILSVFDVITENEVVKSLTILGSQGCTYSELPSWYSAYQQRQTQFLTTNWYQIFEFEHPYYLSIRPSMTIPNDILVCYEAQHVCFETIPTYREEEFLDLAVARIKMNIGAIRSKYSTLETQFGQINLNWETIKSDGKELWDATKERLRKIAPRVTLDIG